VELALRKPWVDVAKARAEWETELQGVVKHTAEPIQSQFVAHMIRKVLPKFHAVTIPGTGHFVYEDAPETAAEALAAFLAESAPR